MEDGRLGIIDFGCTRAFSDEDWRLICELERANLEQDEASFNRVIAKACFFDSPEEMEPDRLEVIRRGVLWNMEPWLKEGLFDFGDRAFFMRGIHTLMEMTRKRYTRGSPLYLWSSRFIFGGRAFCYRMKGRCEFRKIYLQESAGAEDVGKYSSSKPELIQIRGDL
jgi:hypothetical protein